jgi:hypothetical protein
VKHKVVVSSLVCALLAGVAGAQTPVGTAFTYQGRLADAGTPAQGSYDLRFTLYDAPRRPPRRGAPSLGSRT